MRRELIFFLMFSLPFKLDCLFLEGRCQGFASLCILCWAYHGAECIGASLWLFGVQFLVLFVFQSEYIAPCDCRRAFISGFDGSAGESQNSLCSFCTFVRLPKITGTRFSL